MLHEGIRDRHPGRQQLAEAQLPHRRRLSAGSATPPTSAKRRTSTACPRSPRPSQDIRGARVLAVLGDSVTTDHISPAGSIKLNGPAGKYLIDHGVKPADFNSYGSRRGNHEVMVRGTFANVRLRNKLAPGTEGGVTRLLPEGEPMSIYDASVKYAERGTPLVILAGKEYGSGSSRDWAAKGPRLLGVRAVIAESFERIHRSNLVGMGILPLQFEAGKTVESLGLTGEEILRHRPDSSRASNQNSPTATPSAVRATTPPAKPRLRSHDPHRHPPGDPLLRARRHPAVRSPPTRRRRSSSRRSEGHPPRTRGWLSLSAGASSQRMQVTVEIPDEFAGYIVPVGSNPARLLLEDSVAAAYRNRRLTMEQVRQILGFATRMEVDPFLQRYEIYDYTVQDLAEDIDTFDRLQKRKAG